MEIRKHIPFALLLIGSGFAPPVSLSGVVPTLVQGISHNDVVFENRTGLPIFRIEIGDRTLQGDIGLGTSVNGKILVSVSPKVHNLRIVFRGGADVAWHHLDFRQIHEISFYRDANKIEAHIH